MNFVDLEDYFKEKYNINYSEDIQEIYDLYSDMILAKYDLIDTNNQYNEFLDNKRELLELLNDMLQCTKNEILDDNKIMSIVLIIFIIGILIPPLLPLTPLTFVLCKIKNLIFKKSILKYVKYKYEINAVQDEAYNILLKCRDDYNKYKHEYEKRCERLKDEYKAALFDYLEERKIENLIEDQYKKNKQIRNIAENIKNGQKTLSLSNR